MCEMTKKNLESRKIVLSGDLQMLQADSCASRWNTHPGYQSLLTMVMTVEKKDTGIVIYVFGHLCFWSFMFLVIAIQAKSMS